MPAQPLGTIIGNTAAGDEAVDVRVIDQLLGPGVQHSQNADGAADIALVAGQLDDRFARRLHQRGEPCAVAAPRRYDSALMCEPLQVLPGAF